MNAKLCVYGPIPSPGDWLIAPEGSAPPGYLRLCSLSVTPRTRSRPGSDLVLADDALPSQIERLLQAFQRLDGAGRAEVLACAELLAGAAP
jgi:hypothetical protein